MKNLIYFDTEKIRQDSIAAFFTYVGNTKLVWYCAQGDSSIAQTFHYRKEGVLLEVLPVENVDLDIQKEEEEAEGRLLAIEYDLLARRILYIAINIMEDEQLFILDKNIEWLEHRACTNKRYKWETEAFQKLKDSLDPRKKPKFRGEDMSLF